MTPTSSTSEAAEADPAGPRAPGAVVIAQPAAPQPAARLAPGYVVPYPDPLPIDWVRGWVVTAFVTALATITRLTGLGSPTDAGTPVFDEKHYVPQGWQVLHNGVEDNPGFGLVVHPPVGKQLLALGQWMFGYTPLGWRIMPALAGVIIVFLVVRMTRRLTRSTLLGGLAGLFLVADGMTMVTSRVGMLDIFLVLFVVAAAAMLLVDRDDAAARHWTAWRAGRIGDTVFGPRLGVRWWRLGAGVMLGLACGTKWSGLYFVAAFGVMSVAWDVLARRRHGVERPVLGTLVRDVAPALGALVTLPLLVYLATWAGWFSSETATYRHSVGITVGEGGAFAWVPDALRSLWFYSGEVLTFHENLHTGPSSTHPWESKPWTWPMGLRPLLYYYAETNAGCGADSCVRAIKLVGTPALWWLSLPLSGWALWGAVVRRDGRYGFVLVGYLAGYLPWFLNLDRQMYYFYAAPMAPFMVMGLALVCGEVLGRREDSERRRTVGLAVVSLYTGLVLANFVWLYPILVGAPVTPELWQMEQWLPSWL